MKLLDLVIWGVFIRRRYKVHFDAKVDYEPMNMIVIEHGWDRTHFGTNKSCKVALTLSAGTSCFLLMNTLAATHLVQL